MCFLSLVATSFHLTAPFRHPLATLFPPPRSSIPPSFSGILLFEDNNFSDFSIGLIASFEIFKSEVIQMATARMRTIREALKTIKALDPQSSVTYNFIKQLCETEKITVIRLNKKYLLNLDELLKFLSMEE